MSSGRGPAATTARPSRLAVTGLRGRVSGEALLVFTVLLWGFGYTASRYAVTHGFEPLSFAFPRWLIGAVVFVAVALWRERSLRIERRDWPIIAVAAVSGVVINQVAYNYSISFATASTVALIFGMMPIFASIITRVLGLETLTRRHWIATGVSFGGVGLVALGAGGELSGSLGGVLLALVAVCTFALYSVLIGPLMRRYSPYRISAVVILVGLPVLFAVSASTLIHQDWGAINGLAWASWAYIVVMFIVTTVTWFTAIDRVGAAHATLWANIQPFLGAVFAVIVLGETLGSFEIAGAIVIAASIALGRLRRPPVPQVD